jgi:hypothetical protein
LTAEDSPADADDHRDVAVQQQLEGCLVALV